MNQVFQTQRSKIYHALCLTLSERIDQVDWVSFSLEEWTNFANLAQLEGVAPLIHWTLKHEDISGIDIPLTVKAQLMAAFYNTTAQNQVMFQELERILDVFNETDIPVIVLKGAALAATVYPEISLRPMGDLDLLVPKDKINQANQCLNALGYTDAKPHLSEKLNRKIGHHIELRGGPNGSVMVELHWSLIAGDVDVRTASMDWFWERTTTWEENETVLLLNPTANLLYLSAHLMLQHGGAQSRLIWFVDLDRILRHKQTLINWADLITTTKEHHWELPLLYSIEELEYRLDTPLPGYSIEEGISSENKITDLLVNRKANLPLTAANRNITKLIGLNWPSRIHFFFVKLFPHPDFMRWYYKPKPGWIWPLLYPYRWLRLLASIPETINQFRIAKR